MSDTTEKELRPFSGGITFTGLFQSQRLANKAKSELERHLIMDLGYTDVKGGVAPVERSICGCERALDCDNRAGCLFNEYPEDEDEH